MLESRLRSVEQGAESESNSPVKHDVIGEMRQGSFAFKSFVEFIQ